ncbi:MAG TPA: efflux RND transporter periplasmic adaptor subunit [Pyrinomonadaceae bacterium]|nr:efflux RND transporter periplasmic adaptor subunit [Pyrinomonadaceae bacterium]
MSRENEEFEAEEAAPVSSEVEKTTEPESPKRSRLPIYVVSGIIGLCLVIGLSWWIYARQFEKTDDAFIEGNISLITPKIGAHVEKVYVEENQFVRKGDLLIELDNRETGAALELAKAKLQMAIARKSRAMANYELSRKTTRADLTQASSSLVSAQKTVEQTRLASDSKMNSVEQAKNQAKTAEANLLHVQSQIPAAEAALEQARAQVPAAQTKFENAQSEYRRSEQLFASGDFSRQNLERDNRELSDARANFISVQKQADIAEAQLNSLKRQVEVEKSRVNEARNGITAAENNYLQSLSQINIASSQAEESKGKMLGADVLPEQMAINDSEILTAESEIAQAQAAVDHAELELSYTKIYAPQDGYVSKKSVVEGQLVQTDQALMSISLPGIWVVANFKETQIERMRVGQPVEIYVDAYPNITLRGRIESFQVGTGSRFSVLPPENATGNFVKVVQRIPVKIVFEDLPDEKILLAPGMSVVPKVRVR